MAEKGTALEVQNARRKSEGMLLRLPDGFPDTLPWWVEQYFAVEVTTSPSSRKVQRRDLELFVEYVASEEANVERRVWTPRLSRAFQEALGRERAAERRRWSDRTINRVLAHLKTFSKWIHKLAPFPLGDPLGKIKLLPLATGLEIERALTAGERRRLLDAADLLLQVGGRSKDRSRFGSGVRPRRKGYRPYRNRAIIYTLLETGMRRAAVTKIDLADVDFKKKSVGVVEKGGLHHRYQISAEGLAAIRDYLKHERSGDDAKWASPALFLTAETNPHGNGRLTVSIVNDVWGEVAVLAGVEGKTPHSARHAMGKHVMEKTGNVAAVQRQLGHRNAAYSLQYARITADELDRVLNDR